MLFFWGKNPGSINFPYDFCFLLRFQTVHVSWEEAGFTDVFFSEELHGQTLQTDYNYTVWRHTMFKCIKILLHTFLSHASVFDLLYQFVVVVDTLTACCDLKSFKQQIEA